ncbi:MAG: DsbE family thiol:disulfide interchange protein [Rhodospirillales bacterium]|nr:DsbE family thiol:disulfide interchange protein [Rhodospirillales bacterium]
MRHWKYILPLVIFAVLVGFFVRGLDLKPAEVPSPLIGKPAPALNLKPLLDTKPGLADADLKGGLVLVNFFASWCGPCRIEHPLLMDIAAKKIVPILGVNYKDKPEDAKAWLANLGDPFAKIGVDFDGRTAIDWGVYGVPESFLVDANGIILAKQIGPMMQKDWNERFLPKIKERSK